MDVAFIGEVIDGQRVFRHVDSKPGVDVVEVGLADPVEESYCSYVLTGALPELLVDPSLHPVSADLPVTEALPVGSHVSVPIQFSDGRVYGTFCCFAFDVREHLNTDHLSAVRMIAELAGEYIEAIDQAQLAQRERRELIESVLADPNAMHMVFQPLRDLDSMQIVGMEALARFPGHDHGPMWFFSEAFNHGLGIQLELRAVSLALDAMAQLPPPMRLNVNVSPETLCDPSFLDTLVGVPTNRLMVEVTEHAVIDDYTEVKKAAAKLGELGVLLAIDDVGMGFSGLNRILESSPQELKLDAAVIRGVHANPVKQALILAFCNFGARARFDVVAEGIENADELQSLRALGVKLGQGYHLGSPGPLGVVLATPAPRPLAPT